jgi:hypothetical protein
MTMEDIQVADGRVFVISGERDPELDALERWLRPLAL